MPPPSTQPTEIPWKLVLTSRTPTKENLAKAPPNGATLSIFKWEPEQSEAHPDKRVVYYKFTVSLVPVSTFLYRSNKHFDELLAGSYSNPVRIAVLQLRLTADKGIPYFADASPRRRVITEEGFGRMQMSTQGSDSISVGKSTSTIHDQTRTSVTTTTDPGTSWSVDLGVVSFGGSGDTTQTTGTNVTRDGSQNIDVTQRAAATERSDLFSYSTRLSNNLSVLDATHLGSPDLRFTLWAPPTSTLPNIIRNDPNRSYAEALRWRSSGLTGIQEFFAIAVVEPDAKVCLEARLDTVHVAAPDPPSPPNPTLVDATEEEDKVLDYLWRKYPRGFPADQLDVDISKFMEIVSRADSIYAPTVEAWIVYDENILLMFRGYVTTRGPTEPILSTCFYKPKSSVLLEALQEEYEEAIANPASPIIALVRSLTLDTCALTLTGDGPRVLPSPNFNKVAGVERFALDRQLTDALESHLVEDLPLATPRHPRIRDAILAAAANEESDIDINRARDLGIPAPVIQAARRKQFTTLGQMAAQLRRQALASVVDARHEAVEAGLAELDEEVRRAVMRPRVTRVTLDVSPALLSAWLAPRR